MERIWRKNLNIWNRWFCVLILGIPKWFPFTDWYNVVEDVSVYNPNDELVLVELYKDFGRTGSVSGLFICTKGELNSLRESKVELGEVLGKHSEVTIDFSCEPEDVLVVKTSDQEFISKFQQVLNVDKHITGVYPFN